eukprot:2743242-Rhodomonas_salina.7
MNGATGRGSEAKSLPADRQVGFARMEGETGRGRRAGQGMGLSEGRSRGRRAGGRAGKEEGHGAREHHDSMPIAPRREHHDSMPIAPR